MMMMRLLGWAIVLGGACTTDLFTCLANLPFFSRFVESNPGCKSPREERTMEKNY